VAPLQGKGAQVCTKAVAEVAKELGEVEPWKSTSKERPPTTWEELSGWLGARGNEIGADIVVLGTVQGQKLILEAYDPHRVKLIGLKRLGTPKRCRFTQISHGLILDWLKRVVELQLNPGAEAEIADASDRSEEKPEKEAMPSLLGGDPIGQPKKSDKEADKKPDGLFAETPHAIVRPEDGAFISAVAEMAIVSRSFSYDSPRSTSLKNYDISGMAVPGVRIEAHPLVKEDSLFAGLFTAAFLRQSVGVKSARTDGGPSYPTSFQDAGAYLAYRWVGTQLNLAITPHAGFRRTVFLLKPASDGARELQLPNVAYASLEGGLGIDYPLKEWMTVSISGAYLKVLSSGEIFTQAFFKSGGAYAFDVGASLRFVVAPGISAIATGAYERFALHFDGIPNAQQPADGAEDAMLSLRAELRVDF
jgi:hypothetical protein